MRILKTLLVTIVILALAAGALALMFRSDEAPQIPDMEEPVWDVRTDTLIPDAHRPQMTLIGRVEPLRDITEVALLNTDVTTIEATEGQPVSTGQTILTLDDFDARLQLNSTLADLEELDTRRQLQQSQQALDREALVVEKANLNLLTTKLDKQRTLGTQQTIDELEQQVQAQRFAVLQREAAIANHDVNNRQLDVQQRKLELALSSARRQLEQATLAAPFDGILAKVHVKAGQRVSPGQTLYRLYSQDALTVSVQLPTSLLGQQTELNGTIEAGNRVSPVTFDHAEAQLEAGQSGFNAWFRLEQPGNWLPGDVVRLTLNTAPKAETLAVPATAVFQDKWIYQVDEEQRLAAVEVNVLGGLTQGEKDLLVVEPQAELSDQVRVLLTRLNNPTTGMKIYEAGVDPEPVPEDDMEDTTEDSEVTNEDSE
ncbi:efflux RND transporter periplasmic adaptor subunit [Reinekea blandensis]|uniref:Secretion protein HlyD n=1 Tax=Reinekea blandensis MED297 TaxID=314283 RepID=A4BF71_9GAMM|nr:biotin/lipoyl-binding protein [Reinekea blandensis]EAR09184.1 Secretion protein HlyD [Reinekea sp. MED297] [Reinekea blandensis MED297]